MQTRSRRLAPSVVTGLVCTSAAFLFLVSGPPQGSAAGFTTTRAAAFSREFGRVGS